MADPVTGTVSLKKKGNTQGLAPGSASGSKRNAPLAITGGGSTLDPIPRKTRVVGNGEY